MMSMDIHELIWINTMALVVAAVFHIGGLSLAIVLIREQRKATEISEQRLAAMLEAISNALRQPPSVP